MLVPSSHCFFNRSSEHIISYLEFFLNEDSFEILALVCVVFYKYHLC